MRCRRTREDETLAALQGLLRELLLEPLELGVVLRPYRLHEAKYPLQKPQVAPDVPLEQVEPEVLRGVPARDGPQRVYDLRLLIGVTPDQDALSLLARRDYTLFERRQERPVGPQEATGRLPEGVYA